MSCRTRLLPINKSPNAISNNKSTHPLSNSVPISISFVSNCRAKYKSVVEAKYKPVSVTNQQSDSEADSYPESEPECKSDHSPKC